MLVAALGWSANLKAQTSDRKACADAHLLGQELRQASKPLAARDQFFVCAAKRCPAIIQQDCGRWLEEVQAGLPSIVLSARSASGQDIVDATVTVDGRVVAKRLDGRPIALDPGQHAFVFSIPGQGEVRVEALLKAGVKNREIVADFPAKTAAGPGLEAPRPPVAFWVLAGVGTVGVASFGLFAALGESEYQDLKASCAPACSTSDTESVDTKFLVADISLGVAAVAYAGAAYFYFSSPNRESKTKASQRSVTQLIVSPTNAGAFLGVRGTL